MVQNGHEVGVGFAVGQPSPGQLKHLSGAFCVYVNLVYRKTKPNQTSNSLILPIKEDANTIESCHLGNRTGY